MTHFIYCSLKIVVLLLQLHMHSRKRNSWNRQYWMHTTQSHLLHQQQSRTAPCCNSLSHLPASHLLSLSLHTPLSVPRQLHLEPAEQWGGQEPKDCSEGVNAFQVKPGQLGEGCSDANSFSFFNKQSSGQGERDKQARWGGGGRYDKLTQKGTR